MRPDLRAIADRFIYEQATLKHIAALAPEGALARPVPGYTWSAGQLLGHLANDLDTCRMLVERWLAGEAPFDGLDADEANRRLAAANPAPTVEDIHRLFGNGLEGLFRTLGGIPEERLDAPMGHLTAIETLRGLTAHALSHAIALVDALPEVRMDPLVLNWLLDAEFESESERRWQAALLQEAREYIANHPQEDEDDE